MHEGEGNAEGLGWVISRRESSLLYGVSGVTAPFMHTYSHHIFVWFKGFTWQAGNLALGQAFFRYNCIFFSERTERIWPKALQILLGLTEWILFAHRISFHTWKFKVIFQWCLLPMKQTQFYMNQTLFLIGLNLQLGRDETTYQPNCPVASSWGKPKSKQSIWSTRPAANATML